MPKMRSKSSSASKEQRSSAPKGPSGRKACAMAVFKDKPPGLKSLALPVDAEVAIVSRSAVALQKLRKRYRLLADTEVRYFSSADTVRSPRSVVNARAFTPDARA